jgi:hypothetical protein
LPRGSNATLRIRAAAEEAEVPVVCTVYYRTDGGLRGQSNMRRVGRIIDGYQSFILDGSPLSGLSESFEFSVHGLDDRLDGYRIDAVEPPAITDMQVNVRYPDYLRGEGSAEFDLQRDYQAGLRIAEGSHVTMVAQSSAALGDTDFLLKTDKEELTPERIEYSEDRREVRLTLNNFAAATTIRLVPKDESGISAQAPYRYFVGVVLDEPPELELRLQGIGTAVTPNAKLPIAAVATDDYGVDHLKISVAPSTESEDQTTAEAVPEMNRDGEAETLLDLRDLVADGQLPELAPGGAINVFAEATDRYDLGDPHLTRSEVFRLQVVTAEELLALLERRELALRARLEQTIDETRSLRETLDLLRRRGFEAEEDADADDDADVEADDAERTRVEQVRRLRVQQSGLQASKTAQELSGIAASLDDLLEEMVNNRVDSVDRRERIGTGVRDPLREIVDDPLTRLQEQIRELEKLVTNPPQAAEKTAEAVETAEDVILRLTAVLEKMLDLESYNEILEMVRDLIDDQADLLDETKEEQKRRVLDLFQPK